MQYIATIIANILQPCFSATSPCECAAMCRRVSMRPAPTCRRRKATCHGPSLARTIPDPDGSGWKSCLWLRGFIHNNRDIESSFTMYNLYTVSMCKSSYLSCKSTWIYLVVQHNWWVMASATTHRSSCSSSTNLAKRGCRGGWGSTKEISPTPGKAAVDLYGLQVVGSS